MLAEIITTGTELITGAALDTNSAWLSDQLGRSGAAVTRHTTVGDDRAALAAAIREAAARADFVIITGGLGPTLDDVTRDALADVTGQPLELDPASLVSIEAFFKSIQRPMSPSNRLQAMCPRGATVLENAWGTAPGIRAQAGPAVVYALPGVPREMKEMFAKYVRPELAARAGAATTVIRVVRTFGAGESVVGGQIAHLMEPGRNPAVGTTASEAIISVRIVARGQSPSAAADLAAQDVAAVRAIFGPLVYGEDDDTLAAVVGRQLAERRQTLVTAESCTGGLIGQLITDVSGSSAYYLGGFVTYSNDLKRNLVNVPADLLDRCGAVSEEVAAAMAAGARAATGSDYALSATGVAGPTGGTPDKPVGLVFIGLAGPSGCQVKRCQLSDRLSRAAIRERTANTALDFLRRTLLPT